MRIVYASPNRDLGSLTFVSRTMDLLGILLYPFGFKGFYRASSLLSQLFSNDQRLIIVLGDDSKLLFCARDPYWLRLLSSKYGYEEEIDQVLKLLSAINYAFLDCGANLGYWAVKVTGKDYGQHPTIAIEPVPETFKLLEENNVLNNNKFHAVQAAVYSDSGLDVTIAASRGDSVANAGAHIVIESSANNTIAIVKTVTIEQIVREAGLDGCKLVVKLDVEGAEIPALEGAGSLLQGDVLLIYEDHGMDEKSVVSRYLLDLGFSIFWVSNGTVKKIDGIEQIFKIKRNRSRGYNFFAARPDSSFYKLLLGSKSENAH